MSRSHTSKEGKGEERVNEEGYRLEIFTWSYQLWSSVHLVQVSSPAKTTLLPLPTNWSRRLSSVIWEGQDYRNCKGELKPKEKPRAIQSCWPCQWRWADCLLSILSTSAWLWLVGQPGTWKAMELKEPVKNRTKWKSHLKSFPWASPDVGSGFAKVCSTGSLFWQEQFDFRWHIWYQFKWNLIWLWAEQAVIVQAKVIFQGIWKVIGTNW